MRPARVSPSLEQGERAPSVRKAIDLLPSQPGGTVLGVGSSSLRKHLPPGQRVFCLPPSRSPGQQRSRGPGPGSLAVTFPNWKHGWNLRSSTWS